MARSKIIALTAGVCLAILSLMIPAVRANETPSYSLPLPSACKDIVEHSILDALHEDPDDASGDHHARSVETLRKDRRPEFNNHTVRVELQAVDPNPHGGYHKVHIEWPGGKFDYAHVKFEFDCTQGADTWQCFLFDHNRPPIHIHPGNFCKLPGPAHPPPAWEGWYFDDLWVTFGGGVPGSDFESQQFRNAPNECYGDRTSAFYVNGKPPKWRLAQLRASCYYEDVLVPRWRD